jgi:hypothetical protein
MSEAVSAPTRDDISAAIAEKAWKDEAFHKEVLANPNKVYEQYLGQPVPTGVTIKVLEDTATTVHFVLPAKPANAGELSDAELEDVAGGVTPTVIVLSAAGTFVSGITFKLSIQTAKKNGW